MGRMHYPAPLETGEAYDKIADWFMAGMSASPCGMPFLEELAGNFLNMRMCWNLAADSGA